MSSTQGKFSPLFSRKTAGGPYTIAGIDQVPGDVFFVDSQATSAANAATAGITPDVPFATLAYAFSSDRVTSGDVVYVMPGHAEDIDAAGDITMDIAGVTVIGLGSGASRPTFTFKTSTAATWLISAANVTVKNVLITTSGTIDVVNGIAVSAADCRLEDVEIRESASDSQFVDPLIVTTGGARCKLVRYVCRSHASGDAIQSGILIDAAIDGVEIDDAWIDGLFATGNIESTAAATNTIIRRPILRQRHASQAAAINLHASNTGATVSPRARITLSTGSVSAAFVGAAMQFYDSLAANAAGEGGKVVSTSRVVSKASGAISGDPTTSIFTIAGGEVIIRDLWLKVTTSITTDSGTLAMQINPTTGDTFVIVTATDLGTTDTVTGSVVGLDRGTTAASKFLRGGRTDLNAVATTGTVELVGAASVNGAVTVYCTWEPVVAGATLVAS